MIPQELESFENIGHYQFKKRYFVYFLYNNDQLRYVGRTNTHPLDRAGKHKKDKIFTDIYFIQVTRATYAKLEKKLIAKFRPLYNHRGRFHRKPKKAEAMKKELEVKK